MSFGMGLIQVTCSLSDFIIISTHHTIHTILLTHFFLYFITCHRHRPQSSQISRKKRKERNALEKTGPELAAQLKVSICAQYL